MEKLGFYYHNTTGDGNCGIYAFIGEERWTGKVPLGDGEISVPVETVDDFRREIAKKLERFIELAHRDGELKRTNPLRYISVDMSRFVDIEGFNQFKYKREDEKVWRKYIEKIILKPNAWLDVCALYTMAQMCMRNLVVLQPLINQTENNIKKDDIRRYFKVSQICEYNQAILVFNDSLEKKKLHEIIKKSNTSIVYYNGNNHYTYFNTKYPSDQNVPGNLIHMIDLTNDNDRQASAAIDLTSDNKKKGKTKATNVDKNKMEVSDENIEVKFKMGSNGLLFAITELNTILEAY
jgi:hypothetical protein